MGSGCLAVEAVREVAVRAVSAGRAGPFGSRSSSSMEPCMERRVVFSTSTCFRRRRLAFLADKAPGAPGPASDQQYII